MPAYYVHFIDDDPVIVYGPYSLGSAKDFARIGSIPGKSGGGRRAVFTGPDADSRLVRVYEEGERVWPRSVAALAGLEDHEIPRVLAPKPKKGSTVKLTEMPNPASGPQFVGMSSRGEQLMAMTIPSDIRYSAIVAQPSGRYVGQVFDSGAVFRAFAPDGSHSTFKTQKEAAEALAFAQENPKSKRK